MYKVGSYRNHMNEASKRGIEILPVTVHYSAIAKGKTCEAVSKMCSNLQNLQGKNNTSGMRDIVRCGEGGPSTCKPVSWD